MLRYDDVGRGFLYRPLPQVGKPEPPCMSGVRETCALSPRAVRQLKGAAIKAYNLGKPLRTFITFTIRAEDRQEFESGESILGKEIRRTINGLKQWCRRSGRASFVCVWVAENVRNENPHVHMLTDLNVPHHEFRGFAARVESLWGYGFAKVERVKKPEQAGRYLMKALGYTLKGGESDQGRVLGNRYGISREILPKYETYELCDCAEAVRTLRELQATMTGEIEELSEGMWLTRHGLAFAGGTPIVRIEEIVDYLSRGTSQ